MRVRPSSPDVRVPYPQNPGRALPVEGDDVPESIYWIRRLLDGDVVRDGAPTGNEPIAPLTTRSGAKR